MRVWDGFDWSAIVRRERLRRGWSQRKMSGVTGIPLRTVNRCEAGAVPCKKHRTSMLRHFPEMREEYCMFLASVRPSMTRRITARLPPPERIEL